jgi:hypothetical protein
MHHCVKVYETKALVNQSSITIDGLGEAYHDQRKVTKIDLIGL